MPAEVCLDDVEECIIGELDLAQMIKKVAESDTNSASRMDPPPPEQPDTKCARLIKAS
jgi:hypothetical protein